MFPFIGISWLPRARVVELYDADGGNTVDDLARFCCHNQEGRNYGKRGAGNLSICMRYGKHQHLRLLSCGSCKARFSERQGTPLFGAKGEMGKMGSVLDHLSEGCGVRKTSRLTGVHRDTVIRYSLLAGEHAKWSQPTIAAGLMHFWPSTAVSTRTPWRATLRRSRPRWTPNR